MRYSIVQSQEAEIAIIDGLFRESTVKIHHYRFVLRTDRTECHESAVGQLQPTHVFGRVGSNGKLRNLAVREFRTVQNKSGIQCYNPIRGDEQRIDIDLFDPTLFRYQVAKTDQYSFQRLWIDRSSSTNPFQRLRNAAL